MEVITYIFLGLLTVWSFYYVFKKIKNEVKKGKCAACSVSDACKTFEQK
jgi:uncharacterized membrane protein YuzA (DUF378 family)